MNPSIMVLLCLCKQLDFTCAKVPKLLREAEAAFGATLVSSPNVCLLTKQHLFRLGLEPSTDSYNPEYIIAYIY